jgi:hypothetical protein
MKARLASTSNSINRSTLGCTTQHIPERFIILLTNLTVKLNATLATYQCLATIIICDQGYIQDYDVAHLKGDLST